MIVEHILIKLNITFNKVVVEDWANVVAVAGDERILIGEAHNFRIEHNNLYCDIRFNKTFISKDYMTLYPNVVLAETDDMTHIVRVEYVTSTDEPIANLGTPIGKTAGR